MSNVGQAKALYAAVSRSLLGRKPLVEFIGDNTADNLIDEFGRTVQVELEQFVCGLLNGSSELFQYAFSYSRYPAFAKAINMLATKYSVADGMERGDLELKVEGALKKTFSEKYAAMGPDSADLMAKAYAAQVCTFLQSQSPQVADLTLPQHGKAF